MDLDGDRVALREFLIDDWARTHEVTSRPEVCRYQPWGPNSPEETRAYVRAAIEAANQRPRTEYTLAATLRQTGGLIGYGSVWVRSEEFRIGEIGYFMHPDYWSQGLGSEIANLLLRLGFERLQRHRIYAVCDPRNVASKRVLEKVGMEHEGRLRQTMLIRDGWRDSDIYSILEQEYREAPGA